MQTILNRQDAVVVRQAALDYAAAGQAVLPVNPETKAPLNHRGVHGATRDCRVIRAWFACWPDALVGVATGSGRVVIDVDPRNGGALVPEWPATRMVSTRSGGWHLYYGTGASIPNSAGRIARGVDV